MSYDPAVALAFFKSAGNPVKFPQGASIFREGEKSHALLLQRAKMYCVYDGEVSLVARKKIIVSVQKGEVFGELAPLTHAPRTAGAVAQTACRVFALDERQFQGALAKKPAFALMLMSVMVARLRQIIAMLRDEGKLSVQAPGRKPPYSTSASSPTWCRASRAIRRCITTAVPSSSAKAAPACACTLCSKAVWR